MNQFKRRNAELRETCKLFDFLDPLILVFSFGIKAYVLRCLPQWFPACTVQTSLMVAKRVVPVFLRRYKIEISTEKNLLYFLCVTKYFRTIC